MKVYLWRALLAASLTWPYPASGQLPASETMPVVIENSRALDFLSSVNHHLYRLNISFPLVPPPPHGYRVLYLLDGNYYFGSATEAVRSNGNATDVIVVGIGYPDTPRFVAESEKRADSSSNAAKGGTVARARGRERYYDLTLPATADVLASQTIAGMPVLRPSDVGGIDDLLRTIEVDVKPRIAALAPIDANNQALFGHSLGGLAVVRALFTEPAAFRTFIAASPSIWWAGRAVLAAEGEFVAKVKGGLAAPRILITVGAQESLLPAVLPPGMERVAAEKLTANHRMIENASDLAERLRRASGTPGYQVSGAIVFPDQAHGVSVWPALGRAVTFAFQ